ncbi:MAG: hypothetical protein IKR78_02420 [Dehalococcoidales bacterium]|nr:hypothetical protein [Dehalococcoidales bacterium]
MTITHSETTTVTKTTVMTVPAELKGKTCRMNFDIYDSRYVKVSDYDTALEAFICMKEQHANYVFNDPRIRITIWLPMDQDISETPEYMGYMHALEHAFTLDEQYEIRAKLNEFSKKYHEEQIQKRLGLLGDFEYDEMQVIGYSPVVVLLCNIETLEFEDLCYLAERVGGLSLSFEYTVVSAVDL